MTVYIVMEEDYGSPGPTTISVNAVFLDEVRAYAWAAQKERHVTKWVDAWEVDE